MLLRVITQVTTLCSFALAVPASRGILGPYGYGFDIGPLVKRQNEQPIVVSSLPAVNSSMPIRPEIRELKRNSRKWNLYILALSMMQHTDQDEELSWYQITGIHGVPFVPWNGVEGVTDGASHGYCAHMSILFPTWHRPYLALYEVCYPRYIGTTCCDMMWHMMRIFANQRTASSLPSRSTDCIMVQGPYRESSIPSGSIRLSHSVLGLGCNPRSW